MFEPPNTTTGDLGEQPALKQNLAHGPSSQRKQYCILSIGKIRVSQSRGSLAECNFTTCKMYHSDTLRCIGTSREDGQHGPFVN